MLVSNIFIFAFSAFLIAATFLWNAPFSDYNKAREKQIKEDIAEFGHCCGLQNGVCTYEPRLKKLDQQDSLTKQKSLALDAAKINDSKR